MHLFAILSNDSKQSHKLAIHFWNTTSSILIFTLIYHTSCKADFCPVSSGWKNLSLSSDHHFDWLSKMGNIIEIPTYPRVYQRISSYKENIGKEQEIWLQILRDLLIAARVSHTPCQCGKHDRNSFGISCIQPHLCSGKADYACTTQPNCATKWNLCNPQKILCDPSDEESHHHIPRLMFFQQCLDSCPKHFHLVEMSRGTSSLKCIWKQHHDVQSKAFQIGRLVHKGWRHKFLGLHNTLGQHQQIVQKDFKKNHQ